MKRYGTPEELAGGARFSRAHEGVTPLRLRKSSTACRDEQSLPLRKNNNPFFQQSLDSVAYQRLGRNLRMQSNLKYNPSVLIHQNESTQVLQCLKRGNIRSVRNVRRS